MKTRVRQLFKLIIKVGLGYQKICLKDEALREMRKKGVDVLETMYTARNFIFLDAFFSYIRFGFNKKSF